MEYVSNITSISEAQSIKSLALQLPGRQGNTTATPSSRLSSTAYQFLAPSSSSTLCEQNYTIGTRGL